MNRALHVAGRRAILLVNKPVATARFRRAVHRSERPIALEIGGRTQRPGWLITDVGALTRHYMDATSRWPLEDGALSHVYSDNVIEHLSLPGARALLAEAHRCLRPGGVIRIVTPDIRRHVELYLSGDAGVQGDVAERYRSMGVVVEHPVDLVRTPIGEFGHHAGYVYDYDALAAELTRAGFHDPVQVAVSESAHEGLRHLERRTERGESQLVVEAVR